jgi:hypothetical protein
MRIILLLLVVAVNVALAVQTVLRWNDPHRSSWQEPAPVRPALADAKVTQVARVEDLGKYRESLDRPLFSATRRPVIPKKGPEDEKAKADALKYVKIAGIYGAGERGGALLSVAGKLQRLAFGAKIGGWKLVGDKGRSADFVSDSGEHRYLKLEQVAEAKVEPAGATPSKEAVAAPAAAQPSRSAPAPSAAAPQPWAPTNEQRQQALQERVERINQARLRRGLPPIEERK